VRGVSAKCLCHAIACSGLQLKLGFVVYVYLFDIALPVANGAGKTNDCA